MKTWLIRTYSLRVGTWIKSYFPHYTGKSPNEWGFGTGFTLLGHHLTVIWILVSGEFIMKEKRKNTASKPVS
ncbi:MAG: hypothetical protein KC708_16700, partial [Anaerolineae bacterium]|nr:hypothetical protein [Anaerolineae bacterium]